MISALVRVDSNHVLNSSRLLPHDHWALIRNDPALLLHIILDLVLEAQCWQSETLPDIDALLVSLFIEHLRTLRLLRLGWTSG